MHCSGRQKITTEHQDRIFVRKSKQDPRKSAVELNGILNKNYGAMCSVDSRKRHLLYYNLFGRRPVKKPLILLKNHLARMKFAKDHYYRNRVLAHFQFSTINKSFFYFLWV